MHKGLNIFDRNVHSYASRDGEGVEGRKDSSDRNGEKTFRVSQKEIYLRQADKGRLDQAKGIARNSPGAAKLKKSLHDHYPS